ncbi:helix-turn-helix domain-containing protein [Streptomyces sp. NPDC057837]|uniref:helix-turn-helix domain-containing protein n=1 Tax=Streptomyces sp. NPDC057837 TaxID=3346260 RepID=UPI0036BD8E79
MPRPTPPDDRVLARRRQVGDHIRGVREHHNLSQQDVCGRSGIDVASYSRIEQGHSSPKLDTLIRIADAIGVELDELVGRGGADRAHPQRGEADGGGG